MGAAVGTILCAKEAPITNTTSIGNAFIVLRILRVAMNMNIAIKLHTNSNVLLRDEFLSLSEKIKLVAGEVRFHWLKYHRIFTDRIRARHDILPCSLDSTSATRALV